MGWIKEIIKGLIEYFAKNNIKELPTPEVPKVQTQAPKEINWSEWCMEAMMVSGSFEGNGTDWGNPVGNFDGAYLTCGLLGYTWKWNNQAPMILRYVDLHGVAELYKHMPRSGKDYVRAARMGEDGSEIVSKWTSSVSRSQVSEPYKSELNSFWSSAEMKQIQIEAAEKMFGVWAKKKCLETQSYFGLAEPRLQDYCYWFDQAVLNGTGKTPDFKEHTKGVGFLEWMQDILDENYSNTQMYEQSTARKNAVLWGNMKFSVVDNAMMKLAVIRSDRARNEFKLVVMNRRGAIAAGKGFVNGSFRQFKWYKGV